MAVDMHTSFSVESRVVLVILALPTGLILPIATMIPIVSLLFDFVCLLF